MHMKPGTPVTPRVLAVDYGRNKDRGNGTPPHAIFDGEENVYLDDEELLKRAKNTTVIIEQSAHYKLLDALNKVAERVRLVNQFDVHRIMEERGIPNTDDLAAARIIFELRDQARDYEPTPQDVLRSRVAYRTYADTTKLLAALKNRGKVTDQTRILDIAEDLKAEARRTMVRALKDAKADNLFADIKGVGEVAPSFWLTTRPWRFPVMAAWLGFCGFRADRGTAYNHEMAGIMHTVAEGLIKAKDSTYYPLYLSIKTRLASDYPLTAYIESRKAKGKRAADLEKGYRGALDAKAKNRIKTLLLKEVWRRMGPESAWFKQRSEVTS